MLVLQLPISSKCQSRHEFLLRTLQSSESCSMALQHQHHPGTTSLAVVRDDKQGKGHGHLHLQCVHGHM